MASSSACLHYSDVDPSTFQYKEMTKGAKSSMVYVNNAPKIQLNYPIEEKIVCPFGVTEYEAGSRKSLDMSLKDPAVVKFWQAVDEQNILKAIENKEEWFKSGTTEAEIRRMYFPLITLDDSPKAYDPKLHTKTNMDPTKPRRQLKAYIMTTTNGKDSYVEAKESDLMNNKFMKIVANVDIVGMWFQKLQFGMTVITTDLVVFPESTRAEFEFNWGPGGVKPSHATTTPPQESKDADFDDGPSDAELLAMTLDVENNQSKKRSRESPLAVGLAQVEENNSKRLKT
jgi:hypothetical protein